MIRQISSIKIGVNKFSCNSNKGGTIQPHKADPIRPKLIAHPKLKNNSLSMNQSLIIVSSNNKN